MINFGFTATMNTISNVPQLPLTEKLRLTEVNFLTKITIQDLNAGSLTPEKCPGHLPCSASTPGGQGGGWGWGSREAQTKDDHVGKALTREQVMSITLP